MSNFSINAVKRRVVLSGSAGTGPYAFTFEILDQNDISVFKDTTKLTLTADYTVTINTNGTGSVTLGVAATSSNNITIIGARDIERTTDFVTAGDLKASSLNEQLDALTIFDQQINERVDRAVISPVDDPQDIDMTLPSKSARVGKYLAFNATTGQPEAGPSTSDVNTLASVTDDIATLADTQDGTTATNAISTLAGISANVTTVAGISGNVTTVAGMNSNISTVVTNITDIQNAEEHAQEAKDYSTKTNGQVQENGSNTGNYSSKAWAIGGTGVTDSSGSGSAKEWATDTSNTCDGTEYSAKEYAIGTQSGNTEGSAKQWALGGGAGFNSNTAVSGSLYSAKYWAEQAAASASDFDNKYHGPQSSDPTTDPDGSALEAGDLYFSTTTSRLRVYDGSSWNDAVVDTTGFATAGFSIAMSIAL